MIRPGEKKIGEMTHSDLTQFIGNILATQNPDKASSVQQMDVHHVLNVKDKINLSPQAKSSLLGGYLLSSAAAATYETITHAASTYAPLASPVFTGVPLSTTPPTADNSTKIATTAYVQAQGYVTTALTSFNGRATPAAVPTSGDYTAAQVTNAADKASASQQTFTGSVSSGSITNSSLTNSGVLITSGGGIQAVGTSLATVSQVAGQAGDTQYAFSQTFGGTQSWGPGGATARDTTWGRTAAGVLALTLGNGIGYGTGTGGSGTCVAGASVTINKATGQVTASAGVINGGIAGFGVTNSTVTIHDTVIVNLQNGAAISNNYTVSVSKVAAGSFTILFINNSGATITPIFNYAVIKGAIT